MTCRSGRAPPPDSVPYATRARQSRTSRKRTVDVGGSARMPRSGLIRVARPVRIAARPNSLGGIRMRRIAAVVAVVVGFTLVGFVVAEHLFSRSADAQTIADHYRPLLSSPGLAGLQGGFDELKAAGAELGEKALP